MTCQVILGNGHGLAIASDTTVTIAGKSTHDTAEKIHPMGLPHRMAVLHAGSVNFHGMPYGVLIKEWIHSLGNVQLRHVDAYVNSFVDWLNDNLDRISHSDDRDYHTLHAVREWIDGVWKRVKTHLGTVSEEHHVWATTQFLRSEVERVRAHNPLDGYGAPEATAAMNYLWSFGEELSIAASIEYWFDDIPRNEEIDQLIHDYILVGLEKGVSPSGGYATITFAGFGSEELYGTKAVVNIAGALRGKVARYKFGVESVIHNYPRQIFDCVAQSEAIYDFLYGYSDSLLHKVGSKIGAQSDSTSDDESEHAGDISELEPLSAVLMREAESESQETRLRSFKSTVSALPILSLAETARRLVGIQSLHLMIQGEVESVSKESQTAVITRSDGFKYIDELF